MAPNQSAIVEPSLIALATFGNFFQLLAFLATFVIFFYLQLKGRFFNGITLPEVRPMDVESEWIGAIKQSLEGSSDDSPQS